MRSGRWRGGGLWQDAFGGRFRRKLSCCGELDGCACYRYRQLGGCAFSPGMINACRECVKFVDLRDDCGDIIRSATLIRQIDQSINRIGEGHRAHNLADLLIADQTVQPVGAEDHHITRLERQMEQIDLHLRLIPQSAGNHIAIVTRPRLVGGDHPGCHLLTDQRMVA